MPGQYEGEITRFCLREQGSNPRNLRRPARGRGELYQLQRRSDRGRPEPDLRGKPHADRSRCGLHAREIAVDVGYTLGNNVAQFVISDLGV